MIRPVGIVAAHGQPRAIRLCFTDRVSGQATRWGPSISVYPLARDLRQRLIDLLEKLSDEQWGAPTVCAGWSVHDVVGHLLGNDLGRLSRVRDHYPAPTPRLDESVPRFLDRINREWVTAAARLSPRLLTDLLAWAADGIAEHGASLDPNEIGSPVYWAGAEPAPVWLDLAREYTECWVHQQQIREAIGAPALDEPRWRAPVVDTFTRALPHTLAGTAAADGTKVVVRVTGESGGTWTAARQGDGWLQRRGDADRPAARVETDPDTFWRLCTRNITLEQARPRMTTEGDQRLVEATLRMVSIIVSD